MHTGTRIVTVLALAIGLSACAGSPHQRTAIGAGTGAVAGGVIGHQIDRRSGRYVGAAVGALAGGAIGAYMDNQERAFNQALAAERQRGLEIQRMQDGSIKLDIPAEISFDFDRADIKPAFAPSLDRVAAILREYPQTTIDIIGHTDSIGSDAYNLQLSQRRADSVAGYLASRGVERGRIRTEGRGEREPRASNETEAGRQLNRRVEMYVRPITQAQGYDPRFPQGGDPTNPQGLPGGAYGGSTY